MFTRFPRREQITLLRQGCHEIEKMKPDIPLISLKFDVIQVKIRHFRTQTLNIYYLQRQTSSTREEKVSSAVFFS